MEELMIFAKVFVKQKIYIYIQTKNTRISIQNGMLFI